MSQIPKYSFLYCDNCDLQELKGQELTLVPIRKITWREELKASPTVCLSEKCSSHFQPPWPLAMSVGNSGFAKLQKAVSGKPWLNQSFPAAYLQLDEDIPPVFSTEIGR